MTDPAQGSTPPPWMQQGGSGFGDVPPPPTTTPAVLVVVAVISILWSLGCGCFQAVGFTTVASIAALRGEDPVQLEKMVTDGLDQAESQQLAAEPDETKRQHIKSANDFMRRHSKELITAMLGVSAELNRSGVGTLLGFLTLSNLPFLVGAVLMLGRRRIGRFLLLFTSTVMVMLVAGVVWKMSGPIDAARAATEEFLKAILASPDAAMLDAEARSVLEQGPRGLTLGLTVVNLGSSLIVAVWPVITLLVVGLSKSIDRACDQ